MTRTFVLHRDHDVTGISGTGPVADGAVFPDGVTVVRWRDLAGPAAERGVKPTTVVFPDLEAVEALHGHGGATRVVFQATGGATTLAERVHQAMKRRGWTQRRLAREAGFSEKHVSHMLVHGAGTLAAWDRLLQAAESHP